MSFDTYSAKKVHISCGFKRRMMDDGSCAKCGITGPIRQNLEKATSKGWTRLVWFRSGRIEGKSPNKNHISVFCGMDK